MENPIPHATKKKKTLIKDKLAFVDSVAKPDMQVFDSMLKDEDKSSQVTRLFIGASENMPSRVLSYLAAAARVLQLVESAQLQVISVSAVGAQINGIDREQVREQFSRFAHIGSHILSKVMPEVSDRVTFAEDTPASFKVIRELTPLVEESLRTDPLLHSKLSRRGTKHGGDFRAYTAAHIALQDTHALELVGIHGAEPVAPRHVVSVGCLQEKIFFEVRQNIRQQLDPGFILPSAQVFSLHASAPYFMSRDTEQTLDQAIRSRSVSFEGDHSPSIQRELDHLELFLNGGRHHEE